MSIGLVVTSATEGVRTAARPARKRVRSDGGFSVSTRSAAAVSWASRICG